MGKINKIINKIFNRGKFVNNILIVSKKGKYGAVNSEGNIVIDFIYDDLHFFRDYQNFLIGERNGKSSIINTKTLKPIVENITFEQLKSYARLFGVEVPILYDDKESPISIIKDEKGNLGLFDFSTGKYVCGFTDVSRLGVDKFLIKQGEKFGVISQDFKTILSPEYDFIDCFGDNYIACKGNASYIITPQNNFIPFDKISEVEHLIPTDDDVGSRLLLDPIVPPSNPFGDCYFHTTEDLFIVEKKGKEYLISLDNNGDIKFLSEGFDHISRVFCADRSVVKEDEKFGYISLEGNLVIPCEFDSAEQFKIGLHTEKIYRGAHFEEKISYKSRKRGTPLAKVGRNGFYGCVNVDGTVVIPCVFDKIGEFVDGVAPATFYGVNGQINEKGEGFDIEKILSSFNNKENLEKIKEQYDKELGE